MITWGFKKVQDAIAVVSLNFLHRLAQFFRENRKYFLMLHDFCTMINFCFVISSCFGSAGYLDLPEFGKVERENHSAKLQKCQLHDE